jgi:mono/diheme cytochrome c family protein
MSGRLKTILSAGIILSAFVALMPVLFPLSGEAGPDWVATLGRFHLMVLHFPIALILMVPVFEVLGRIPEMNYLKPGAFALLVCSVGFSAMACVLGFMLAVGEGDSGGLLVNHMWAGIATTVIMSTALIVREFHTESGRPFFFGLYSMLLAAGVVTLTVGSHHGASLVHGDGFLFERLPVRGEEHSSDVVNQSAYQVLIEPIFRQHCYSCHSAAKTKGGFRIDKRELMLKGGDSEFAGVIPGNADESEVYLRISTPPGEMGIMPPKERESLSEEQIALVQWWISTGASATNTVEELAAISMPEGIRAVLGPMHTSTEL